MIKSVSKEQLRTVRRRLNTLYGGRSEKLLERFFMMIGRYGVGNIETLVDCERWDERDSVLITYADTIHNSEGGTPLNALDHFARNHLKGAIRTIHLLPFYPWTSDDGFSVVDYREVADENGTWSDVEKLGKEFDLMFDLVCNHCSAESSWFKDFVAGVEPARHYFLSVDPKKDYSEVVRPRTSPLLTKTTTSEGEAYVWTTFSADQVDLNWQNPDLLFEFLDILFFYISKGMRIVRLDAVAFVWKKLGTNCIHLPETHEIVKLMRDIMEIVSPRTIVLTETNVPHEENISYFGYGDEAHMVYQFSLPPLLLHGLATENAEYLTKWASELAPPPDGCTFFNFTASHDGVGVRPIEGLLPEPEKLKLIEHVENAGGKISWRNMPDGSKQPYELNVTYYSALADEKNPDLGIARFLCSQAVMLSLRGIPGIYIHSLVATENDLDAVKATGMNRRINRHKYQLEELETHLTGDSQRKVFDRYLKMLRRRANHPAFHPDAEQHVFDLDADLFIHSRISLNRDEVIFCIYNFTAKEKVIRNPGDTDLLKSTKNFYDILSAKTYGSGRKGIKIAPYQALWLVPRK